MQHVGTGTQLICCPYKLIIALDYHDTHPCFDQAYTSSAAPLITIMMTVLDTSGENIVASVVSPQLKVKVLVVYPDGIDKFASLQVIYVGNENGPGVSKYTTYNCQV